jgi:hypothetical protein
VDLFAPLDVDFAVTVNELSAPVQGSGADRTGADTHHAGILDRKIHHGFVIRQSGHALLVSYRPT